MEKALFKLDEFCGQNKIEYMVTGTVALSLLGVPSHDIPRDIDIIVFHANDEQLKKLSELEFLSGYKKECYPESECYTFAIEGVKVNAIIDRKSDYGDIALQSVCLCMVDEATYKHRHISAQKINYALSAKMKLNRDKDKSYMLDLIHSLTHLGQ